MTLWPTLPTPTVAGALKMTGVLVASGSLALLTAVAGNALADGPRETLQHAIPTTNPRANTLLFCTIEREGLRCVEDVF